MYKISCLFFELIQVAIGHRKKLSHVPTKDEWYELFELSQKQAVVGVAFLALNELSKEGQKPPLELLYEWIGSTEQIKNQNRIVNKRCVEITRIFRNAGYRTCILKGQGNAMMYPDKFVRTSGDIDIWVEGKREDIRQFVISKCPNAEDGTLHIHFPVFNDVEVEVHYNARRTNNPFYNRRLQKWIKECSDEQFLNSVYLPEHPEEGISIPTAKFNVVHQLFHIMSHFFIEGVGLRHFVDYYYVLKKYYSENNDSKEIKNTLRYLGAERFARGVMWIEKVCLGLEDDFLLVKPSQTIGRVILKELEEGGNFGHYDERYKIREEGVLVRGIADTYRLLKLSTLFPSESAWKIFDKISNQKWRLKLARIK